VYNTISNASVFVVDLHQELSPRQSASICIYVTSDQIINSWGCVLLEKQVQSWWISECFNS